MMIRLPNGDYIARASVGRIETDAEGKTHIYDLERGLSFMVSLIDVRDEIASQMAKDSAPAPPKEYYDSWRESNRLLRLVLSKAERLRTLSRFSTPSERAELTSCRTLFDESRRFLGIPVRQWDADEAAEPAQESPEEEAAADSVSVGLDQRGGVLK